ncbi:hypothetical protein D3C81_1857210 [compost metagenome]
MADPIHHHIGHGLHVGRGTALGFPVDGARKAGDGIVQRRGALGVDRLHFGWGDGAGPGWRRRAACRGFLLQGVGLVLRDSAGFALASRQYLTCAECR